MSNEHKTPINPEEARQRFGNLDYHGATDTIEASLARSGQTGPRCSTCGNPMTPCDDHGRYSCFCNLLNVVDLTDDD